MYHEMYLTPRMFAFFVFGVNATLAGEPLQCYNDGGGGKP